LQPGLTVTDPDSETDFLSGHGRYVDDLHFPDEAVAVVLRSPYAHAAIRSIDLTEAKATDGALLVIAAADVAGELGDLVCDLPLQNRDGTPRAEPGRPILARDKVRHIGEPVAFVVAETLEQAKDAAERINVTYDALPVVVESLTAAEPGAAQLFDDVAGNLCFDWEYGDAAEMDRTLAGAAHIARQTFAIERLAMSPIEPRAAVGLWDVSTKRHVLHATTQSADYVRRHLAKHVFRVDPAQIRVLTPDVGGAFGVKHGAYPEYALVLLAARRLERPVRWTCERSESFLSDAQARDHIIDGAIALDDDGKILGIDIATTVNAGAYLGGSVPLISTFGFTGALGGPYTTGYVHCRSRCLVTNLVPLDAYRGSARPEAVYVVERLIDAAARELRLSPVDIRRRNLIQPTHIPYTTATGHTYDSGDFPQNLTDVLELSAWESLEARRAETRSRDLLHGAGIVAYVHNTGGPTRQNAEIDVLADGQITVTVGNKASGQGQAAAYAKVVATELGVPTDRVTVRQGDSDHLPFGEWTGGSGSMQLVGGAVHTCCRTIIDKGVQLASHHFECDAADIEFSEGVFKVAGTDRVLPLSDVAALCQDPDHLPDGMKPGLDAYEIFERSHQTYANGCHVCEVAVDPESGFVEILSYAAVDDFGTIIDRPVLEGQVYGSVVQGIGQALMEGLHYGQADGQLLSGSYMDYALPRADEIPRFRQKFNEVPCRTNPLGVKGAGEGGTIAAVPVVINAVLDALAPLGVRHLDMPATPQAIRAAIVKAAGQ